MVLPVYTYGQPILRQRAAEITGDSPELQRLIDDMIETMHVATGVGIAAPQVGQGLRLFVIDLSPSADDIREENGGVLPDWARGAQALINPEIVPETGCDVSFEEGCLSMPDLREDVLRPDRVRLRYLDRTFQPHEFDAVGYLARVVQHELDHLNGVLFTDRVSALRKRLLQRRLRRMAEGEVEADYPLLPPRPAR
jgi:peptide deformylase